MEQKINIAELLKDAPKETKLYSPAYGEVLLKFVAEYEYTAENNIISGERKTSIYACYQDTNGIIQDIIFNEYGELSTSNGGEIILFPSKDCRTWKNFTATWLQKHFKPLQKVLVPQETEYPYCKIWRLAFYSNPYYGWHYTIDGNKFFEKDVIPYEGNEDKLGKEVKE